jgi:L-alanine-DL-glutamate epimerase-like enolase superfamily enzyme
LTLRNLTDGNQIMHQLLVRDIVARPDLTPQAGKLGLVEGPGFGFELDWDAVGQAAEIYREALSRDR